MPKDHYIAQTYLKEFLDPASEMLHVHQKNGLYHPAHTADICFEIDGSNNPYFTDQRIIEDYLKVFEPQWTRCVASLREKRFDREIKYLMAGYIAFLRTCNPTARRLGKHNMEFVLEASRPYMAKDVAVNHARDRIENPSQLIEGLLDPDIRVDVDSNYPYAINMQNLVKLQELLTRSPWMVVYNETDNPFITCDFPATYWYFRENYHMANLHIAITPQMAINLMPIPENRKDDIPPDRMGTTERRRIKMFNRLVVQSAERFVISNSKEPWITNLISKYGNWRMESMNSSLPTPDGTILINHLRARERITARDS